MPQTKTPKQRQVDRIAKVGLALDAVRKTHDWSFQNVADRIETVTHFRRSQDCWRKFAKGLTKHPNDRTLCAVDEFLDYLRQLEEADADQDKKRKRSAA